MQSLEPGRPAGLLYAVGGETYFVGDLADSNSIEVLDLGEARAFPSRASWHELGSARARAAHAVLVPALEGPKALVCEGGCAVLGAAAWAGELRVLFGDDAGVCGLASLDLGGGGYHDLTGGGYDDLAPLPLRNAELKGGTGELVRTAGPLIPAGRDASSAVVGGGGVLYVLGGRTPLGPGPEEGRWVREDGTEVGRWVASGAVAGFA